MKIILLYFFIEKGEIKLIHIFLDLLSLGPPKNDILYNICTYLYVTAVQSHLHWVHLKELGTGCAVVLSRGAVLSGSTVLARRVLVGVGVRVVSGGGGVVAVRGAEIVGRGVEVRLVVVHVRGRGLK